MAKAKCWNCQSENLVIKQDPEMSNLTDMIICLDCNERQDADSLTDDQINSLPDGDI